MTKFNSALVFFRIFTRSTENFVKLILLKFLILKLTVSNVYGKKKFVFKTRITCIIVTFGQNKCLAKFKTI